MIRLRRGFLKELDTVFEDARVMQGGYGDPETIQDRQVAILSLKRELLRHLAGLRREVALAAAQAASRVLGERPS